MRAAHVGGQAHRQKGGWCVIAEQCQTGVPWADLDIIRETVHDPGVRCGYLRPRRCRVFTLADGTVHSVFDGDAYTLSVRQMERWLARLALRDLQSPDCAPEPPDGEPLFHHGLDGRTLAVPRAFATGWQWISGGRGWSRIVLFDDDPVWYTSAPKDAAAVSSARRAERVAALRGVLVRPCLSTPESPVYVPGTVRTP